MNSQRDKVVDLLVEEVQWIKAMVTELCKRERADHEAMRLLLARADDRVRQIREELRQ